MATYKKINFIESPEGIEARQILTAMVKDENYNTKSSYTANVAHYPDMQMTFVEKHMAYLSAHPKTDPEQYLSNLRLMTKIK